MDFTEITLFSVLFQCAVYKASTFIFEYMKMSTSALLAMNEIRFSLVVAEYCLIKIFVIAIVEGRLKFISQSSYLGDGGHHSLCDWVVCVIGLELNFEILKLELYWTYRRKIDILGIVMWDVSIKGSKF